MISQTLPDQLYDFYSEQIQNRAANLTMVPIVFGVNVVSCAGIILSSSADFISCGKIKPFSKINQKLVNYSNIGGDLFVNTLSVFNPSHARIDFASRLINNLSNSYLKLDSRVKALAGIPVMILARTIGAVVSPILVVPAILTLGKYQKLNTLAYDSVSTTFILYEVHRLAMFGIFGIK